MGGGTAPAGPSGRKEREELAARAAALPAEREARAAAEELNRAKSRFLAVMSHEFRSPLNAIIGYAGLQTEEIAGPLTDRQRDHLQRITASGRHLLGLIDNVLDLSRVEAGRLELREEVVDVAELARNTVSLVLPAARDRGLRLESRIPDQPLRIRTDAGRTRQILLNLLSNAIKFTDTGGVTVSVEADGDEVPFEVADTGIGIAADHLEHIFGAFRQADDSATRTRGGSGLDLAVSREFARVLGDVTVESVPGGGSTFTLALPQRVESGLQLT